MKLWHLLLLIFFTCSLLTATVYGAVVYGAAWVYNDHKTSTCTTETFNNCMTDAGALEENCNALAARRCND